MVELKKGIYRHYKGNLYRVLGIGRNSETLDEVVIYQALYDSPDFGSNSLWARPVSIFLETVSVDGVIVPRFSFLEEEKDIVK